MLEEPDEAMVGEAHGHAADCWPSGRGPSSLGLWRTGGVSATIDVNRVLVWGGEGSQEAVSRAMEAVSSDHSKRSRELIPSTGRNPGS